MAQTVTSPEQNLVQRVPPPAVRWPAAAPVLAFVFAFTCAVYLLLAVALPRPVPPSRIDLLGPGSPATESISAPAGVEVTSFVHEKTVEIGGDSRPALFTHPPASANFWLQVPAGSRLEFSMGLDPAVWDKPGDGVDFQISARAWNAASGSEDERMLFSRYLDPRTSPAARRWIDASADLEPFAGRYVLLTFQTLPHDSTEYDWALWSDPRIVR